MYRCLIHVNLMTVNSIIHANVTAINIKYILMLRVIILIKNHKKQLFYFVMPTTIYMNFCLLS